MVTILACQKKQEYFFPRTAAEDTEKIMSDKYWSYWTPEVQARIDADIDKNRKADAVFAVGDVRTKVLRQVVTAVGDGAVAAHYAEEYISLKS